MIFLLEWEHAIHNIVIKNTEVNFLHLQCLISVTRKALYKFTSLPTWISTASTNKTYIVSAVLFKDICARMSSGLTYLKNPPDTWIHFQVQVKEHLIKMALTCCHSKTVPGNLQTLPSLANTALLSATRSRYFPTLLVKG